MIKKFTSGITTLSLICLATFLNSAHAQEVHHICGTDPHPASVERLLANKEAALQSIDRRLDPLYVPVKFHLVGMSNGTERIEISDVFEQVCDLNNRYAGLDMEFYLRDDAISFVNNTSAFLDGEGSGTLFNSLKDPNAVNIFVVKDAADASGGLITLAFYDPIRDYIVSRKDMIQALVPNVMPHEVGHYFSLLHTFNGWERDPYDQAKHGNPVNITTAPDNSTPVELVDKSNCSDAGDFICDTEPDYNFGITQSSCNMPFDVQDSNGDVISVVKENYMTYFFNCGNYLFTPEQQGLIRIDYLSAERAPIRDDAFVPSEGNISGLPNPIMPGNGDFESVYNAVLFEWTAAPGADRYFLEVSTNSSFTNIVSAKFIRSTSHLLTELSPSNQYFWRVKPVNDLNYCIPYGPLRSFMTGSDVTSTNDLDKINHWSIRPNFIKSGSPIQLFVDSELSQEATYEIFDGRGTSVMAGSLLLSGSQGGYELAANDLSAGVYYIRLRTSNGQETKRFVVTR